MIKQLSMVVGFMVRRTHSMMMVGDIILKNASSKDPLISYLEMLDHFMRYKLINK